ncbi:phenylalanine--tRNA ligase subunit beta [Kineococcus glutinatus]|uniref:Phenylalanine--tRNA ligase beta subunit n=1 Tax=Kineococcus glutinatus TaxID=1070872 RepID=A0ABP9HJT1_9ACTN
MRVPLPWLAEHVDLVEGHGAEEVAAALVRVGLEEEAVHRSGVSGPVVVGRVLSVEPEPQKNGKTINWCSVDVGGPGPRGIVCGAHNFTVGDSVVVALPGAVLPGPFAIAARKTYGHVSDGMICSAAELGLGEDHAGIIVLGSFLGGAVPAPGADALALLGLDEETVEVNVTPDRGYCFSIRGVAREYAHATGRPVAAALRDPAAVEVRPPAGEGGGPRVRLADATPLRGRPGCDRFVTRIVTGLDPAAPSPAWLRRRLQQAGMRSISLPVDVTNYVMLATGQPLHAYDRAALRGDVVVRRAGAGERLTTLDGVERVLHPEDLLITDEAPDGSSRVLGLAGVMGGADSEVGTGTTDLVLEAAHFDQVSVARTARRHKLPSEAARRFERGVDPALPPAAAELAVRLLVEHGGAVAAPGGVDVDERGAGAVVQLPLDLPSRLVGVDYAEAQVREVLTEIGCTLGAADGGVLQVHPPSWRPDLAQPVDLVEEVARLRGYDAIPSVLPAAPAGRGLTRAQRARRSVARALADAGAVEVLSYPFVAPAVHEAMGLPADDPRRRALRLLNPLSDEQPLMRTSVLDSLVEVLRRNVSRGSRDLVVFEVGSVALPRADRGAAPLPGVGGRPAQEELAALAEAVPAQPRHVAALLAGARRGPGWQPDGWGRTPEPATWADAVELARTAAAAVGVELGVGAADVAPWHPGRCARLATADGVLLGFAGELHPRAVAALELPERTCALELDLDALVAAAAGRVPAPAMSAFPAALQDVSLVVDAAVPAADVEAALRAGGGDLLEDVRLFDVYTGDQVGAGQRSLAFGLRFRAADRTLTAEEAGGAREAAVAEAARRTGAVQRA